MNLGRVVKKNGIACGGDRGKWKCGWFDVCEVGMERVRDVVERERELPGQGK
jgi:hypothetical protein